MSGGGGLGREVRIQFGEAAYLTSESPCLVLHRLASPLSPFRNDKRAMIVLPEILIKPQMVDRGR